MMTSALSHRETGHRPTAGNIAARIGKAAATVGLLDGLYVIVVFAILLHVVAAERIFQGIAHAVLGPSAYAGGAWTTALGVVLHFLVALGWSCVWALVYESNEATRRFVAERGRAVTMGVAYGVFVWLAMRFLVLPLTHNPPSGSITARGSVLVLLAHVLVVGPPIVLLERRAV